jgi:hypothetical protein
MTDEIKINYNWLFGFATVVYRDKQTHLSSGADFNKEIEKTKNEIILL